MKRSPFGVLAAATTAAALLAACSGSSPSAGSPPDPAATAEAQPPDDVPPADMKPLATSIDGSIVSALSGVGLDVNALPPSLDAIAKNETVLKAVMRTFTRALGVECSGCHAASGGKIDYEAPTRSKKVAAKMWSELVVKLAKKDGGAIYCDTCHQGKKTFVDRNAGDASLRAWMQENFVDKLTRKDAKEHGCPTCHGDPFRGPFLDDWSK